MIIAYCISVTLYDQSIIIIAYTEYKLTLPNKVKIPLNDKTSLIRKVTNILCLWDQIKENSI